jgi:nitrite reductase (NO-forming)
MLQGDAAAKAMLDKFKLPMPNQGLSDAEIKQYIAYFKWADQNLQPRAAEAQPAAGGASQSASAAAAARPILASPQPTAPGSTLAPSRTQSATPMPKAVPGPAQGNPGGMGGMVHE